MARPRKTKKLKCFQCGKLIEPPSIALLEDHRDKGGKTLAFHPGECNQKRQQDILDLVGKLGDMISELKQQRDREIALARVN